ncbi:MAG: hypothetical protein QM778_25215 [Myxococcales bacterium]
MKSWILRGAWAALLSLGSWACIIGNEKCDAHQVELNKDSYSLCVCEPNAVINANGVGCTPCGANEEAKDDQCVCKDGFAKLSADGGCEPSAIGGACNVASDCSEAFPYCTGESGYCTARDCSANADCPAGWSCEAAGDVKYCKKAPSGLGSPCESNDDCSGFEAAYCDQVQSHTCILQGCAVGDAVCPSEWGCCDYSALLGSPLSVCVGPDALSGGSCPSGGSLVTP